MKPLKTFSLTLCVLAVMSAHSIYAGSGPFSLTRICQDNCVDESCCDESPGWLKRICNFSTDDSNCIDDECVDDGCIDYKSN